MERLKINRTDLILEMQMVDKGLSKLDYRNLQYICNHGGASLFTTTNLCFVLDPRDWRKCYDNSRDCKAIMVRRIVDMIHERKDLINSGIPQIQKYNAPSILIGPEVHYIREVIEALPSYHVTTLELWCRTNGGPKFTKIAKHITSKQWLNCINASHEEMISNIRNMLETLVCT